ncbi:MAG TPA: glycosyltransferase family 39 protein, partial [Geobacteraceae bacterium]|nr:glycosyltransferase family 39 protein [Geobacteraceae bacterium]
MLKAMSAIRDLFQMHDTERQYGESHSGSNDEFRERLFPVYLWAIITVFFVLNAVSLYLVSPTADLDQAEQLVLSQSWQFGYTAQPPLYTWMVRGVLCLAKPGLAPLLAIKVFLLSALAAMLLETGRLFSFTRHQYLITIASLTFIPQIIWEGQRDLTHSVLATVLAAATLMQTVRTHRDQNSLNYILLGLLAGLGLLSKYNFAVFILCLALTVLLTSPYRKLALNPRIVLTIVVVVTVFAPHLHWMLDHVAVVTESAHKLKMESGNHFYGVATAFYRATAFLTPLWILALLVLTCGIDVNSDDQRGYGRFMVNLLGVTMIVVALFVLISGAQKIKDRWFQPLLFFVPVLIALYAKPLWSRVRIYCLLSVVVLATVAVALPVRTLFADIFRQTRRPNIPYQLQFSRLAKQSGEPAAILAESKLLGGNARSYFGETSILTSDYDVQQITRKGGLLVLCEEDGCRPDFRNWMQ